MFGLQQGESTVKLIYFLLVNAEKGGVNGGGLVFFGWVCDQDPFFSPKSLELSRIFGRVIPPELVPLP